jgi:hypothetical protein
MNVNEFNTGITCEECGKTFYDRRKKGRSISRYKQLAGHIMRSEDHPNKKWAKKFLLDANVGSGLWGDKRGGWV